MDKLTINGKDYRVEVNWNAITALCTLKGLTDLSALDNIANLSPDELMAFLHICVEQGELADGRKLGLSKQELSLHVRVPHVHQFISIFTQQSTTGLPTPSVKKKKKRWSLFRR